MLLWIYATLFSCTNLNDEFPIENSKYFLSTNDNISLDIEGGESGPEQIDCDCAIIIHEVDMTHPMGCPISWQLGVAGNCSFLVPIFAAMVDPIECWEENDPNDNLYENQEVVFDLPLSFNCSTAPNSTISTNGSSFGYNQNHASGPCNFPCLGQPVGTITYSLICNQSDVIGFPCDGPPAGYGFIATVTVPLIGATDIDSNFSATFQVDECCRPTVQ